MAIRVILNTGGKVLQKRIKGDNYVWDDEILGIYKTVDLVATFDLKSVVGVIDEGENKWLTF